MGAGISFIFYLIGIRWTAPTTASMVAMVEPVTASLFGVLLIGDHLTIIQLLRMVIILVTITVLSVKQSKNNAFPPSLGLLVLVLFKNTASFA
ncbi:EamA family transporter [Gracilibacillus lacisalsi]|uniref:EamA family transporter n=1 Tax=Gracilibacillus lacisalsi TaxID=393087 RepID=UPI0003824E0F